MMMRFRCYYNDDDFKHMPNDAKKKWNDNGRKLSEIEYDTMLNTDHIVSLEEKKLFDLASQTNRRPIVLATMSTGKTFFIKANSIPELQLKSVIDGKGDLT